jgi:hypothetical protein
MYSYFSLDNRADMGWLANEGAALKVSDFLDNIIFDKRPLIDARNGGFHILISEGSESNIGGGINLFRLIFDVEMIFALIPPYLRSLINNPINHLFCLYFIKYIIVNFMNKNNDTNFVSFFVHIFA